MHQVESRDQFRHRMLDLQARIHFQEIEILRSASTRNSTVPALCSWQPVATRTATSPMRRRISGIDQRRGRLLHHFLVAALDGALALAQIDRVAVLVRQHLHLDVPGVDDGFLEVNFAVSESPLRLALCRFQRGLQLLRRTAPGACPLPPPPAAAFSITG